MKRFQSKKKKQNKEIDISYIIDSEIKGNSIRQGFSKGIQTYSQRFNKLNYNSHKDMTHIPFVTIDGEKIGGGLLLLSVKVAHGGLLHNVSVMKSAAI